MIAQLRAQLRKEKQLARKDQALALAEVKIQSLEERLRLERIARYGKRSETLSDLQLELLDLEPGVSSEEIEAESNREPITTSADGENTDERSPSPSPVASIPAVRRFPRISSVSIKSLSALQRIASAAGVADRPRSSATKRRRCLTSSLPSTSCA